MIGFSFSVRLAHKVKISLATMPRRHRAGCPRAEECSRNSPRGLRWRPLKTVNHIDTPSLCVASRYDQDATDAAAATTIFPFATAPVRRVRPDHPVDILHPDDRELSVLASAHIAAPTSWPESACHPTEDVAEKVWKHLTL